MGQYAIKKKNIGGGLKYIMYIKIHELIMMLKISFMVIFDIRISTRYSENPLKREGISIYPAFPIKTIPQCN